MTERQIAVIGKFDALHRGHFALVEAASEFGHPVVLSFSGMAAELGWEPRLPVTAPDRRSHIFAAWSQQLQTSVSAITLPFAQVRAMTPQQFLAYVIEDLGMQGLVCGEDFRFGRDRQGGVADIQAAGASRGLDVAIVSPVMEAHAAISSSRVREALARGDVAGVWALLDRPFELVGTVERGAGRGRTIQFPTANLGGLHNQPPATGVYAAWVMLGDSEERLPAAVNVGHAPTVADQREQVVEAHVLDWSGDCYGQLMRVAFVARIRPEQTFSGVEALRSQITQDVAEVRRQLLGVG